VLHTKVVLLIKSGRDRPNWYLLVCCLSSYRCSVCVGILLELAFCLRWYFVCVCKLCQFVFCFEFAFCLCWHSVCVGIGILFVLVFCWVGTVPCLSWYVWVGILELVFCLWWYFVGVGILFESVFCLFVWYFVELVQYLVWVGILWMLVRYFVCVGTGILFALVFGLCQYAVCVGISCQLVFCLPVFRLRWYSAAITYPSFIYKQTKRTRSIGSKFAQHTRNKTRKSVRATIPAAYASENTPSTWLIAPELAGTHIVPTPAYPTVPPSKS